MVKRPTRSLTWSIVLSEVAYVWWQITHPVAALRERARLRKAAAAAMARFEAFKRVHGIKRGTD